MYFISENKFCYRYSNEGLAEISKSCVFFCTESYNEENIFYIDEKGLLIALDSKKNKTFSWEVLLSGKKIKKFYIFGNVIYILDSHGDVWSIDIIDSNYISNGVIDLTYKKPEFNNVMDMCVGLSHVILLDCDGFLWSKGSGSFGQLGTESWNDSTNFMKIEGIVDIIKIICKGNVSYFIDKNNIVWGCGSNSYQQLTKKTKYSATYVPKILTNKYITDIKTSGRHTLFMDINNVVFSVGKNEYGELGLGFNKLCVDKISKIDNIPPIKKISCGEGYSLFLDHNDYLWFTGKHNITIGKPSVNRPIKLDISINHKILQFSDDPIYFHNQTKNSSFI